MTLAGLKRTVFAVRGRARRRSTPGTSFGSAERDRNAAGRAEPQPERCERSCLFGETVPVENAAIADQLDMFASLLELGDANPYTARAYRRAAETIRAAALPVAELV